ncbi:hypothetical protein WJX81_001392 [Elliptochloris bilobata]|uniref:Uncharacterized protein n=1 Tax=Elliptochloris bilobata TaxID=381761 RepID=A0AAW1SJQ6_9CHLO
MEPTATACEVKVAQLEKKLLKSEALRQRLREGLEKAKHSAAATSELLRQHALLQQTAAQAAAEVDALRRSEAEAGERLAKAQAESERLFADASREREQAHAQLAAMQLQQERAQRAIADAKAEALRALSAAQKSEAELGNLRKQVTATRERVKDLEHRQKADHSATATVQGRLAGQRLAGAGCSTGVSGHSRTLLAGFSERARRSGDVSVLLDWRRVARR